MLKRVLGLLLYCPEGRIKRRIHERDCFRIGVGDRDTPELGAANSIKRGQTTVAPFS